MKYKVTEEYTDPFCPSGDNDSVIRSEVIEADSHLEAEKLYKSRHHVDMNNTFLATPQSDQT